MINVANTIISATRRCQEVGVTTENLQLPIDHVSFSPLACHVSREYQSLQITTREGPSTMKKSSRQQISLLIGIFLVILIGCAKPPAAPTESGIVISTFTAAPAKSPAPSEALTPTLAATPDSGAVGRVPGLSPVNVTVGLEGQSFTCTAVKKVGSYHQRTCLKGLASETLYQVVISGREPFFVDFIDASVKQAKKPESKIATAFLGFIASLPYDGSTPDQARAWIESTVPASGRDAQEMELGGVKYILSGPPEALVLEMGELP